MVFIGTTEYVPKVDKIDNPRKAILHEQLKEKASSHLRGFHKFSKEDIQDLAEYLSIE